MIFKDSPLTSYFVSYSSQLRITEASPNIEAISEIKSTPILADSGSTNDWARGEELPPSVALFAANACVEYRSAWTPAFCGQSRVILTVNSSPRRMIVLSLGNLDLCLKPTSAS
ncbi:MAG TPA: hypothetical protein VHE60_08550 [Pyrinomonadaceae bacterium]|nr:hypothetical protein [Pyrinomonadaceae bacterium]